MATDSATWQVESAGVDWITCSASTLRNAQELWWIAEEIGSQELGEGRKRKGWGMKGLRGWSCGSVAWGAREELVVVRAGGQRAQLWWSKLAAQAENISRLDLQLTARSQTPAHDIAAEGFKSASNWRGKGGKPLKTALIVNNDGGATLYVGSRQSDRMGRLYDKGVESESDAPGHRWRWELELKNGSAGSVAHRLRHADSVPDKAASWVASWFRERAVFSPAHIPIHSISFDPPTDTDDVRKLRYLDKSIRPMVQRLVQSGQLAEVLKALGLTHSADSRLYGGVAATNRGD